MEWWKSPPCQFCNWRLKSQQHFFFEHFFQKKSVTNAACWRVADWGSAAPIGLFSVEDCHQDYFSVAFKNFVALYFWQNFLTWCSFSHSLFSIRIHIMPPHWENSNNLSSLIWWASSHISLNCFEIRIFQQKGRDCCVLLWSRLPILFWLILFPLLALPSRFKRSHAYQKYFHKFKVLHQKKKSLWFLFSPRWSQSYDLSSGDLRGTVLCGKVLDGVIKASCAPSIKLYWELLSPYIAKLVITHLGGGRWVPAPGGDSGSLSVIYSRLKPFPFYIFSSQAHY